MMLYIEYNNWYYDEDIGDEMNEYIQQNQSIDGYGMRSIVFIIVIAMSCCFIFGFICGLIVVGQIMDCRAKIDYSYR